MAELLLPKQTARVRFPSAPPLRRHCGFSILFRPPCVQLRRRSANSGRRVLRSQRCPKFLSDSQREKWAAIHTRVRRPLSGSYAPTALEPPDAGRERRARFARYSALSNHGHRVRDLHERDVLEVSPVARLAATHIAPLERIDPAWPCKPVVGSAHVLLRQAPQDRLSAGRRNTTDQLPRTLSSVSPKSFCADCSTTVALSGVFPVSARGDEQPERRPRARSQSQQSVGARRWWYV